MPLKHTSDEIKELDEDIQVIELLQVDELENIQLNNNLQVKSERNSQTDHTGEDLDADNIAGKTDTNNLAEHENQKWVQSQYLTHESSVLKAFLANLSRIPVDNLGR